MKANEIKAVLRDWNSGDFTHGDITQRHVITKEQEFAITCYSGSLNLFEIEERLKNLKAGMKAAEIKAVMANKQQVDEEED